MAAPMPKCSCGGALARLYTQAPPAIYNAAGFYASDVNRLRSQVGPERYAQFEAERDDIRRRARLGRLTAQERSLDTDPRKDPVKRAAADRVAQRRAERAAA